MCNCINRAFGQSFVLAMLTGNLEAPATGMDTLAITSVGILMAFGNLFLGLHVKYCDCTNI